MAMMAAIQRQWRRLKSKHNKERVERGNTLNREENEKKTCFYKGA